MNNIQDLFTKVAALKSYQALASSIREKIISGEIPRGNSLPNEREMSLRTGLSRPSVRQAIRLLEGEGLIEIRTGRNGGSYVKGPGPDTLARSLNLYIWGQNISVAELLETREIIEPSAAALAARNRTTDDVLELEQISRLMWASRKDHTKFYVLNRTWHHRVVDSSHNKLIISCYQSVIEEIYKNFDIEAFTVMSDTFSSDTIKDIVVRIHDKVLIAIKNRDPDAAQRRMRRHITEYISRYNAWLVETGKRSA